MRVEQLCVYPIKSTAPHDLERARVEPWGLADDRRWMVVETDGTLITARREPALLHVRTQVLGPGRVRVSGEHAPPLDVEARPAEPLALVTVWSSTVEASTSPPSADAWFSALLGRAVRLVWLDDPTRRPVNPAHSRPGDRGSFADGYPLLLTTSAALTQVNDWITELALERGEDAADPITLARGREPLRMLARHRRVGNKVLFGANLIPDRVDPDDIPASIAVGDDLTVLERLPD